MLAGIPGSQPSPAESAQADSGGARRLQARVKSERHRPERGTLAVGWFGDRTRILPGTGIEVKRFQVWQELSSLDYDGAAPLHATVTLEMSNEWYSSLTTPDGTIRIELVGHNEDVEARLVLHNAHHDLDPAQLGSKRVLQFVVSPTPRCGRLNPGQTGQGVAKLKFGNRKVTIRLPETQISLVR